MSVRVRFAPSPTGQLHVGNARTAIFNWLFARREGGTFILRIEDTDTGRQQGGAEEAIYEDLAWLGLDWDEGPIPFPVAASAGSAPVAAAGTRGPYRQSERTAIYARAYDALEAQGAAYPCFCPETLLEEDRQRAMEAGRTPGYSGRCRGENSGAAPGRIAAGEPFVLRFRVGSFGVVSDLVRGDVDFTTREAFDPVIRRKDGRPTYNFAVVVDDAAMEITHVLRGEDHLTNTALQLRIYEELGLEPPRFAHLSMIHGPGGTPLSKRDGATSVGEFRRRGYPSEALVNGLALLGWTPPGDKVLLDRTEMKSSFDLGRVHPSPAVFDLAKLDWISGQKIRAMDRDQRAWQVGRALLDAGALAARGTAGRRDGDPLRREVLDETVPGIQSALDAGFSEAEFAWLAELGDLLATSLDRFDQTSERAAFVFAFDPAAGLAHGALEGEAAPKVLEAFAELFAQTEGTLDAAVVPALLDEAKQRTGLKGRALLHPLRAAITGTGSGPELTRVLPLIDRASHLGLTPGVPGLSTRIRLVLAQARPSETPGEAASR